MEFFSVVFTVYALDDFFVFTEFLQFDHFLFNSLPYILGLNFLK